MARELGEQAATAEGIFAATPPLDAIKMLISMAASSPGRGTRNDMKVGFYDAKRAYFNAHCPEPTYVEHPHEQWRPGHCGRLRQCMYGTRAAAREWERFYGKVLVEAGFRQGRSSPRASFHEGRRLRVVVHGDDFTALGTDSGLDWFQKVLSDAFEVEARGRLGTSPQDQQEVRILNRLTRVTPRGYEWEPDPRHAELIIQHMGLSGATSTTTPGDKDKKVKHDEGDEEALVGDVATAYRALAARANVAIHG